MGTTVTTNMGLIKPDLQEKIKQDLPSYAGWASQNASNMDKIDNLFRATTHTYTPTWIGSTGNPTLGAGGFVEGKYIRLFPRMVVCFIRIYTGGAGFATGSGTYNFTVPVAVPPELDGMQNHFACGKAVLHDDSSAATSSVFNIIYGVASDVLFFNLPTNDVWTATNPITLAQQDRLSGYFMYPTSAL